MEQLRLPFPTLKYLAGHAVARLLLVMKVDSRYWVEDREESLKECELRVDKLPLRPAPREYVRNVLRGFFEHVKGWLLYNMLYGGSCNLNVGADILVDAYGNLDERGMARQHFQKRYKDEFFREDFQPFVRFLEHFSWKWQRYCSKDFMSFIVNLQKGNTSLVGPEYRLVGKVLHVVFRFVNRDRVPPECNVLLDWDFECDRLQICMEQKDVLVTYSVYEFHYDEDMFRIHIDLLQPSQRLKYVKKVLYWKMSKHMAQGAIRFLNVLDPETRRNCFLGLNEFEARVCHTAFDFLEWLLIPGYESLFIPMMELIGLDLPKWENLVLFANLVRNIGLIGFDSLLSEFWELLPASKKRMFRTALERDSANWHDEVKEIMKTLSQANMELFHVVFDDFRVASGQGKPGSQGIFFNLESQGEVRENW